MRDVQSWSESDIFSGGEKSHVRFAHALERAATFGRLMREMTTRKHISRVLPRELREFRVSREWP